MDKDQVQVIQILLDTFMKLILAGVAVGLLIGFAIAWTRNPSWPIGIVEVFLGILSLLSQGEVHNAASTGRLTAEQQGERTLRVRWSNERLGSPIREFPFNDL